MTTDMPAEPSVRFRDLGPLEVERAGAASPVGGAQEEAPPGGSWFVDLAVATPRSCATTSPSRPARCAVPATPRCSSRLRPRPVSSPRVLELHGLAELLA
ncbi:MAG: hypothetical protein EKK42_28815 [Pseudonocardiaceae bacterium]|nr:MAG: hypothetical protein EKK42_28815 [Pseudonocardiaceae bacterium]